MTAIRLQTIYEFLRQPKETVNVFQGIRSSTSTITSAITLIIN